MPAPADWNLPPGVTRELWDYFQDTRHAEEYDAQLAGTPLLDFDQTYVDRWVRPKSRILDLGCGTGRAAVRLANLGHRVVGVDLSEPMLVRTLNKAAAAKVIVHALKANIAELDGLADQSFDLVLCLFSTLGMIHGEPARTQTLAHIARLLKPGGRLILHGHNRWWLIRSPHTIWWAARSPLTGGDFTMPPHDGRPGWTMHLFTAGQLIAAVKRHGLTVRDLTSVTADGHSARRWIDRLWPYGFLLMAERDG